MSDDKISKTTSASRTNGLCDIASVEKSMFCSDVLYWTDSKSETDSEGVAFSTQILVGMKVGT